MKKHPWLVLICGVILLIFATQGSFILYHYLCGDVIILQGRTIITDPDYSATPAFLVPPGAEWKEVIPPSCHNSWVTRIDEYGGMHGRCYDTSGTLRYFVEKDGVYTFTDDPSTTHPLTAPPRL